MNGPKNNKIWKTKKQKFGGKEGFLGPMVPASV